MELVVGTANLAQKYGLRANKLSQHHFEQIVQSEENREDFGVDTSPEYGHAEAICKKVLRGGSTIYSKMRFKEELNTFIHSDLNGINSVVILVHNWEELSPTGRTKALEQLAKKSEIGEISGYGFSTYSVFGPKSLFKLFPNLHIQAPLNVLNQENLMKMKEIKQRFPQVKFLARSVFLQGLLVNRNSLPLFDAHPDVIRFTAKCRELKTSPIYAALEFVLHQEILDALVIGVNSFDEWRQIRSFIDGPQTNGLANTIWSELRSNDDKLIDPRKWKK